MMEWGYCFLAYILIGSVLWWICCATDVNHDEDHDQHPVSMGLVITFSMVAWLLGWPVIVCRAYVAMRRANQ